MYAAKARRRARAPPSSASRLARATSSTCTKSRIWPPSSKTRGASPRSTDERNIAATPGVRRVPRHARAVDVVVAQRHRRASGLPRPRRGVVLLRDLARGVAAARVERRVLVDQGPGQRLRRRPGTGSRTARRPGPRRCAVPGLCGPCVGAGVAPLAVHHHRGREHQPRDPRLVHRGEQRGGAEVVVRGVRRQVGHPGARARRARPGGTTTSTPASRSAHDAASRTSSRWMPAGGRRPRRAPAGASGRPGRPRRPARRAARRPPSR